MQLCVCCGPHTPIHILHTICVPGEAVKSMTGVGSSSVILNAA